MEEGQEKSGKQTLPVCWSLSVSYSEEVSVLAHRLVNIGSQRPD